MGKGTTWEIHPKARISTTMFTTLSRKPEMMEERYMEAQIPTRGKNIHLVHPCKQNPYLGSSTKNMEKPLEEISTQNGPPKMN